MTVDGQAQERVPDLAVGPSASSADARRRGARPGPLAGVISVLAIGTMALALLGAAIGI